MSARYLVGFSGPPHSGKDTVGAALAAYLEDRHGFQPQVLALSMPMRHTVFAMLGMDYNQGYYDRHKDTPQDVLGGQTIRQAMIALSEEHVKRRYGGGFWGNALLKRRWISDPKVTIVTDVGFGAERDVFIKHFGFENCIWPQLHRDGCDFSKDSRSYVGAPAMSVRVDNNGTVDEAVAIVSMFMTFKGWDLS